MTTLIFKAEELSSFSDRLNGQFLGQADSALETFRFIDSSAIKVSHSMLIGLRTIQVDGKTVEGTISGLRNRWKTLRV